MRSDVVHTVVAKLPFNNFPFPISHSPPIAKKLKRSHWFGKNEELKTINLIYRTPGKNSTVTDVLPVLRRLKRKLFTPQLLKKYWLMGELTT